jgi:hypothetical protein
MVVVRGETRCWEAGSWLRDGGRKGVGRRGNRVRLCACERSGWVRSDVQANEIEDPWVVGFEMETKVRAAYSRFEHAISVTSEGGTRQITFAIIRVSYVGIVAKLGNYGFGR